ncbi:beta-ketoacyl synthase [Campylobacterota bacterium]|nr:beta-ketoacyl synthase [Campylobacterota bacterium]
MKTAISSYGIVCSLGKSADEVSNNLFSHSAAPTFAPYDRLHSNYVKNYPVFQAPSEILSVKRQDESVGFCFLRTAIDEALSAGGLTAEKLRGFRVGVVAGTSVNASFNCFDFYQEWRENNQGSIDPLIHYLNTPLSSSIQKYYGFSGAHITITTACASGTDAVGIGAKWIEQDICDVVIACATDELNRVPYTGFIRLLIASQDQCAPFSKGRTGINLGEGAAALILESDHFIRSRGATAQGFVLGYGCCSDAYHATAPDPNGYGLRTALKKALRDISTEQIAFINAHATGTQDNDAVEAKVFNDLLIDIPVMASKSHTGHALGAAGAIEAVLSLICLNKKMIAATANWLGEDEALLLTPVIENMAISADKTVALSDSLAFGGCNSVIALGGANYE